MDERRLPYLTRNDVARLWSEAAGKTIAPATVTAYLRDSRAGSGGRWEDHPVPEPVYSNTTAQQRGQIPHWVPGPGQTMAQLEETLRRWWRERPERPNKGGRRPKYTEAQIEQIKELCAEGKTDAEVGEAMGITERAVQEQRFRHSIPSGTEARRQKAAGE